MFNWVQIIDNKKSLLTYNEDENIISLSSDWIKILTEAAIKTVGAVMNINVLQGVMQDIHRGHKTNYKT